MSKNIRSLVEVQGKGALQLSGLLTRFVEQRLGLGTIITNGQVAVTLCREAVTPVFAESKSFGACASLSMPRIDPLAAGMPA
jgi:hypothetical protein